MTTQLNFFLILRTQFLFVWPLIPLFGLLVTSPLGFKARVGSLIHTWQGQTRYTSGATLANRLAAEQALVGLVFNSFLNMSIARYFNTYSQARARHCLSSIVTSAIPRGSPSNILIFEPVFGL